MFDPNVYIERETIDIKRIAQFSSPLVTTWSKQGREGLIESLNGYPMSRLIDSIAQNGFVADHGAGTYHNEPQVIGKSYFFVSETDSGYKLSYGGHRYAAAMALKLKEVDAFVIKPFNPTIKERLQQFAHSLNELDNPGAILQSITLPFGICVPSRDDSKSIFNSFLENDPLQFFGKSVLDVACNLGWFAIEAKRLGASCVTAFDLDAPLVNKGKELSNILGLSVTFNVCDFWEFDWTQSFDYVFANQCVYHFNTAHRCKYASRHQVSETLDKLCSATREKLFMFTFVREDNQEREDLEGYRPSRSELISDLRSRGFNQISITSPLSGAKRIVIATR